MLISEIFLACFCKHATGFNVVLFRETIYSEKSPHGGDLCIIWDKAYMIIISYYNISTDYIRIR